MADVNKFVNYQNINDITTSCYVNLEHMIPYKTLETTLKKSDGYLTVQMRSDNSINCESAIRVQFSYGQQKQQIDIFARYKKDCLHASAIVCKRTTCDFVENNIAIFLAQIKPNVESLFTQYKAGVQLYSYSQQQIFITVKYYVINQYIDDIASKQYSWNQYSASFILGYRQNLFTIGDSVDITSSRCDKSELSNYCATIGFLHEQGQYAELISGQVIRSRMLCFIGMDTKLYPVSNTTQIVNPFQRLVKYKYDSTLVAGTKLDKYMLLDSRTFIPRKNTQDVIENGKMVFAVFSIDSDCNIKSVNKYTSAMQPGYTYFPIGMCESDTGCVKYSNIGRHFYSLNQEGKLTHIDGIPIA